MAARYLLDTNILIAALKGRNTPLLNRIAGIASERFFLSVIVLSEMLTGAEKSHSGAAMRADLHDLTQDFQLLPFDADDAATYARIRATLEHKGTPIGPYDLQIAAQALTHELVLITDNTREFRRVPGLQHENWLR